ncbi:MAG TPA: hypothetical protein VJN94_18380 [Candidatus Binataceae bacterium]|nr:hypothetical protein [Candidatus Binataceae bacterium]
MKSVKTVCAVSAIVLAFISLQHGRATAGGGSPLGLLSGSYSSIFSGYQVTAGSPQVFAGTGRFTSDGHGNLTGHETINFNGNACDYKLKGTYTITADGTGTDAIDFNNGGPGCAGGSYTQSLAIVDGGDQILLSNTNSPDVATEHWYRVGNPSFSGFRHLHPAQP